MTGLKAELLAVRLSLAAYAQLPSGTQIRADTELSLGDAIDKIEEHAKWVTENCKGHIPDSDIEIAERASLGVPALRRKVNLAFQAPHLDPSALGDQLKLLAEGVLLWFGINTGGAAVRH